MNFFLILILILFSSNLQAAIKVNSIIKLKDNVPEECGLAFLDDEKKITGELVIKKHNSKNTITYFSVNDKNEKVKSANLTTYSKKIDEILKKSDEENLFKLESITQNDEMTQFFQEILIGGGNFLVNGKNYEIIGPIDSKVRLEYLFCTGEMFLPNYNKNDKN